MFELFVVALIVISVIALMLPAIQRARMSANRTVCQNNLKQIALALHSYELAQKQFPAGYTTNPDSELPGWGWSAEILPYMEQTAFWMLVFEGRTTSGQKITPQGASSPIGVSDPALKRFPVFMKSYICPSNEAGEATFSPNAHGDPYPYQNPTLGLDGTPIQLLPMTFIGMAGQQFADSRSDQKRGIFYRNSRTHFLELEDGSSNTIMITERHTRTGRASLTGVPDRSQYPPGPATQGVESSAAYSLGITGLPDDPRLPNSTTPRTGDISSGHLDVTNLAFADGSVRSIRIGISPMLWTALGTIAGDEVLPDK
jgi:prepilin-type processing-associated H-X9-DG protein